MKNNRDNIIAILIAGIIAFLYISGIPSVLFVNIKMADVDPVCITLFINSLLAIVIGVSLVKITIPRFELGFQLKNFKIGMIKYGVSCFVAFLIPCIAFLVGLFPLDYRPTVWKVLMEGVIYYISVGMIEEFFCRGLLQSAIEKLLRKRRHSEINAVVITALIFGMGHIFGMIGMPPLLILCKIIWAVGLGIYLGAIYVRTRNLWLVALFHTVIDLCGLPFCFSTQHVYPMISAIIVLITFLCFGLYGIFMLLHINNKYGIFKKSCMSK